MAVLGALGDGKAIGRQLGQVEIAPGRDAVEQLGDAGRHRVHRHRLAGDLRGAHGVAGIAAASTAGNAAAVPAIVAALAGTAPRVVTSVIDAASLLVTVKVTGPAAALLKSSWHSSPLPPAVIVTFT